ncbi:hypothetical protein CKA32_006118 [Geitlerinema sp. FC II]|nr:hypothetical protein CKA32_006118 [Geitlerinema sp. FC II]
MRRYYCSKEECDVKNSEWQRSAIAFLESSVAISSAARTKLMGFETR